MIGIKCLRLDALRSPASLNLIVRRYVDPRIQYLLAVAPTVVLLAVMVIGVVLAILRRQQLPWTARLVIPGLVALAANVIGSIAVRTYARHLSYNRYEDATVAARHYQANTPYITTVRESDNANPRIYSLLLAHAGSST